MKALPFLALCLFLATGQIIRADAIEIPSRGSFAVGQTDPNWGWAACNQMLLNSIGVPDTQEDQVEKLFGDKVSKDCGPGFDAEAKTLQGQYTNTSGESDVTPIVLDAAKGPVDASVLIDALKAGRPFVVATKDHRWVCYGASYTGTGSATKITTLKLIDPQNGTDAKTPLYLEKNLDDLTKAGLIGFLAFKI